jgi:hypothetical protein
MEEKPTAAFVLSLLGGIFALLGGIVLAIFGTIIALFTLGAGLILYIFPIFGIIIIIGSIMMYSNPKSAKMWGIIVLILGIISLIGIFTTFGGILALIGGILAIVWKPSAPMNAPPPPP